jgi:hypothetical protein
MVLIGGAGENRRMEYFVVYRPGQPDTWHITSSAGFYGIALTPMEALATIGRDAEKYDSESESFEFSVRWINTPEGFESPDPEDVPEIYPGNELSN